MYAVQEAVHQVHVKSTPEPQNVLSTIGSNKDTHRSEPRKSAECPSFSVSFRLTLSLTKAFGGYLCAEWQDETGVS